MLNKCMFIGRLGSDPEVRTTASGKSVCNFSIAVSNKWKDDKGEWQEVVEWVYCVFWGKLAEVCGQYLNKGKLVYIEGALSTKRWQKKDGSGMAYRTEINGKEMKMLGDRRDAATTTAGVYEQTEGDSFEDIHQQDEEDIPF